MAAIIEVKYFNTFILKKTQATTGSADPNLAMWNGSRGIPANIGGYPRSGPQVPNNSDTGNWSIEEARIRGGYNNTSTDYGAKAYIVEEEPSSANRINTLIYSGIFNSRTGINNTNVFSVGEDITKSLDPANGSIQKLYAEDTNLNIFQELKVSRALIDKDAIYSAEGGGAVTSSNLVIGAIQPYLGEYGIGTNPESFAIYGYNKYFSDSNKNVILRLSRSGIDEISSLGMRDYFRDELNRIKRNNNSGIILGGWDIYTSQYFVSTQIPITYQQPTLSGESYNTVSFDERVNGWTSFFSFKPDQIFSIRNQMYTTSGGSLWFHNSNVSQQSQALVNGNFDAAQIINIDNIQGTIRKGDIVTSQGIAQGTFVEAVSPTAIQLSKPVSNLNDNTALFFNSLARNKFYGIHNPTIVDCIFNDNPDISKSFKTVEYEGYNGWMVDAFVSDPDGESLDPQTLAYNFAVDFTNKVYSYNEGAYDIQGNVFPANLIGNILRAGFDKKENKYYANIINSSPPSYKEVHFGDQISGIKGFYAVVRFSTDSTTNLGGEKQLFQVGTEYTMNNGY